MCGVSTGEVARGVESCVRPHHGSAVRRVPFWLKCAMMRAHAELTTTRRHRSRPALPGEVYNAAARFFFAARRARRLQGGADRGPEPLPGCVYVNLPREPRRALAPAHRVLRDAADDLALSEFGLQASAGISGSGRRRLTVLVREPSWDVWACAAWSLEGRRRLHVRLLAVRADLRRRGLGGAFLVFFADMARRHGRKVVRLNALPAAVGFYERHGFRAVRGPRRHRLVPMEAWVDK